MTLPRPRRWAVPFVAAAVWFAIVPAAPAAASGTCVVAPQAAGAAALVPGAAVGRDAAFNDADPDAATAPLRSIRYPDEAAMWSRLRVDERAVVEAAEVSNDSGAYPFAARARSDRGVSDSIVRLFCGLFDRRPDPFELEYWADRYWNGLPLVTIAEAFTTSAEFIARYGMPDDQALAAVLYRDVLGRAPEPGTLETFAEKIRAGSLRRGDLIVTFTESPEYVAATATATPIKPPLPYPDDVGSGRRILYTDSGQRIWLIDDTGELVKTHQVSGRRGVPGVGRYRVYSKSRHAWAPYDGITMEYMVRFARGEWPYGFHSIPIWPDKRPLQTKEQLGTHRSGGCVRQDFDDAKFVFDWADIGTRVIVIP